MTGRWGKPRRSTKARESIKEGAAVLGKRLEQMGLGGLEEYNRALVSPSR